MKILIPIILTVVIIGGILYLNFNKKSSEKKMSIEVPILSGEKITKGFQGNFIFDVEESKVKWTGSKKIIKNYFDTGSIKVKNGSVVFKDGEMVGGEITFDMTSIMGSTTGRGGGEDKLTEHLRSADFFEVETYPEAKYVITSAEKTTDGYTLSGDLTLKGETHSLSIQVKTAMENGNAIIVGVAEIDRTVWDIQYGSDKFFDNLGDSVINDNFSLEFTLVARP